MLGAMFSGRHDLRKDNDTGAFFIDRDGTHFLNILNFLRSPENYEYKTEPKNENELKKEADFYGLGDLMFPSSLIPAQPEHLKCGDNIFTLTQDAQGMWFMACKELKIPLTQLVYCSERNTGSFLANNKKRMRFNSFSTGYDILPCQPTCTIKKPCLDCGNTNSTNPDLDN
jgi:hypothetical protein